MGKRRFWLGVMIFAVVGVWLGNSAFLGPQPSSDPLRLLAHRGVHQTYPRDGLDVDTCTARRIYAPQHSFIENTLPSMQAAFEAGAAVVELDVHLTPDGAFAVFHDWELDCRTDGSGVTRQHTITQLQALDVGYGYSSDGVTYPLRGQGVGMMPTLSDVLAADLPGPVLINVKSRDADEGNALATRLAEAASEGKVFGIYGGHIPTQVALDALPGMRGYSRQTIKDCILRYAALGWSGRVPDACRDSLLAVPIDVAPWLWGWPHRFVTRMQNAGTEVILLGPLDDSGFSAGIDTPDLLAQVPIGFSGLVWTNRIEVIGPLSEAQ